MAYRGSNPVSSFLAGFQAVDALETNRQNRAHRDQQMMFQHEQMSRARKLWKRQDDEYELLKLERYREQKLAELDATVKAVIMEAPPMSKMLQDPLAIMQEAHKRMIAADPDFGEHIALAHGLDPAAGSLVNKKNPVSGVGFAPGKGTFYELNTTLGHKQPYTENRTSADNDPVAFRQTGLQELIGIYGAGVTESKIMVAGLIYNMVGADQATGNPLSTQDKKAQQPTNTEANTKQRTISLEERAKIMAKAKNISEDEALAIIQGTDTVAEEPSAVADSADNQGSTYTVQPGGPSSAFDAAMGNRERSKSSFARGLPDAPTSQELYADVGFDLPEGDPISNAGLGATLWQNKGKAGEVITEAAKLGADFVRSFQVVRNTPKVDTPVDSPAKIKAATGRSASDYKADNIANPNEKTGEIIEKTPVPNTPQAVQAGANAVLSTKGRPNLVQVYNAVGLAKLELITPEQLQRYAATGQLNEAATRKLQVVKGEKGAFAVLDITGDAAGQGRPVSVGQVGSSGESDEPADVAYQQKILNLFQDDSAGDYEDNPRGQSQYVRAVGGAFTLMGLPGTTEKQLDAWAVPKNRNTMHQGAKLIRGFNEDLVQTIDLPWPFDPDFKVPMNSGNLAVAATLAGHGVAGAEAGTWALRSYLETLKPAVANDAQLVTHVNEIEGFVVDAVASGGEYSIPIKALNKTITVDGSKSRHEVRQEIIEELISLRQ